MERRAAAYDYRLDVQALQSLDPITNSFLAIERRESHKRYVRRQVETLLGEKFFVEQNTTRYSIVDGRFYGQDMFVPAIDSFRNGRDHRRVHGNPIDYPREDAEIRGIEVVEERMVDSETPVGRMEFFPSLPGGTYKHKFHDIFTKKIDENGQVYVEAVRYSSGMSIKEYRDFVRSLGIDVPEDADAVFFLANPVSVNDPRFQTAEDIHRHLHREHNYMTREEFEGKILEPTSPYIDVYVQSPSSLTFKAVLNRSDEVNEERRNGIVSIVNRYSIARAEEVYRLGNQDIKEENLPCGNLSTSESEEENSAFSVSEFGIDYPFDKFGSCKSCGNETALGPCAVCLPCDVKMRRKKKFAA